MTTNRSDLPDYCAVAEHWVSRHGLASIDPLQRRRLVAHAKECGRCTALMQERGVALTGIEPTASADRTDLNSNSASWPHLAEGTLRAWAMEELSSAEHDAVGSWIEAHLANCEFCADRFAIVLEHPGDSEGTGLRSVIGRAASTPVKWNNYLSDVAWVIDQPTVGATTWKVSLQINEGSLVASLNVDGRVVPKNWSFSVPLSTDTVLLPTLVFSDSQRVVACACSAPIDQTWRATPILTAEVPHWSRLVATGEEPATMVSTMDTTRRDITLRIPAAHDWLTGNAGWVDDLFVDLRGERVMLGSIGEESSAGKSGPVLDSARREIGTWALARSSNGLVELKVTPTPGEIIRVKTDLNDVADLTEWLADAAHEYAPAPHIKSSAFTQQIAFRPSLLPATDRSHLAECQACRDELVAAQRASHPSAIDLALSVARVLPTTDTEAIDSHLAHCIDRQCSGFAHLSMLRQWIAGRPAAATAFLKPLVTSPIPVARLGVSYDTAGGTARPYSAVVECGTWTLTLEESADGVLFIGVRSDAPAPDIHEIYVGLYGPERALEQRLPWQPAEFWPAKTYISGAGAFLSGPGPLRAVVLPVIGTNEPE